MRDFLHLLWILITARCSWCWCFKSPRKSLTNVRFFLTLYHKMLWRHDKKWWKLLSNHSTELCYYFQLCTMNRKTHCTVSFYTTMTSTKKTGGETSAKKRICFLINSKIFVACSSRCDARDGNYFAKIPCDERILLTKKK